MRLFLASNHLGDFGFKLSSMVGDNRRALVIFNARDYKTKEERVISVQRTLADLSAINLKPEELNLKKYFNKPDELREYIDNYDPGCIFVDGGNIYLLATALHLSGMDEILRQGLENDNYVYAGYSAGAIVASKDLGIFTDSFGKRRGDLVETAEQLYGEVYQKGLGIIDEYIIPHMDREDFAIATAKAYKDVSVANFVPVPLNDSDVTIVNNASMEILKVKDK